MYDVEIVEMLNLIHNENKLLFEMAKSMYEKDIADKINFKQYDNEYNRIINSLEKYGSCNECKYKINLHT